MKSLLKLSKLAVLLIVLLVPFLANAQTNLIWGWSQELKDLGTNGYYHAGEKTIEITPNISSKSFVQKDSHTFGMSAEYEYWFTAATGSGVELGSYDLRSSPNGIDHIAIMADYRLIQFPSTFILNKFALVAKTGAETLFTDGTKDFEIGGGINYNLFVKRMRVEISYTQHFRTDPSKNGATVRAGMQFLF